MPTKDKRDQGTDEPEGDGESQERAETDVMVGRTAEPDVYLDVPQVDVEEIVVDVEDLRARVSLSVEVLDLVRLNVGADVALGRVHLDLKGVHAQALLKVRLDRVAEIVARVLATVDKNPQVLEQTLSAVERSVEPVVEGGGAAAEAVGSGAGEAVRHTGRGAGEAVRRTGEGAGEAVRGAGEGAGEAVRRTGEGAGEAIESTPEAAERLAGDGEIVDEVETGVEDEVSARNPQQRTQARKRTAAKKSAKKAVKKTAKKSAKKATKKRSS